MKKTILIGVSLNDTKDFEENIEEMINLAQACDIEVVHTITQKLRNPHKQTYINSGKVEEIRALLLEEEEAIDMLLFDCELTPSQQRNLEELLTVEVVDKSNLILQIFEKRAQTKEAKLQVEVAKLKYVLPRLAGSYANLDRQRGGDKNRGAGEKKIEIDIRNITHQIHCAESELKEIAKNRETQRRQRKKNNIKSVALVGYTNAGKSSIMNALMDRFGKEDKKVFEKDMLFATLTTNTRNIHLENNHQFLISDTVGFISDLPHNLIKAFHSTLEEVIHADLLIQVIDISSNEHRKHMQVTKETLSSIDAGDIEVFNVFNKCDLADINYPTVNENNLYISAKDEASIDLLINEIDKHLFHDIHTSLLIPYQEGALISRLNNECSIIKQEHKEDGILIELNIDSTLYESLKEYAI
ncbi:MAG: GTPase HflX [Bacilli bacterium]|nr:GTPase HflX [Bacilli bacterium]